MSFRNSHRNSNEIDNTTTVTNPDIKAIFALSNSYQITKIFVIFYLFFFKQHSGNSILLLFSHFLNIIQILVPTMIPTAEMINAGTAISISSILLLNIHFIFSFRFRIP